MPKPLNVKRLKELLANAPDDAPVLVPAPDHSYRLVTAEVGTACWKDGSWTEDCGPECELYDDIGEPIPAVIIH